MWGPARAMAEREGFALFHSVLLARGEAKERAQSERERKQTKIVSQTLGEERSKSGLRLSRRAESAG